MTPAQQLEEQKKRVKVLEERRTQAAIRAEAARRQLEALRKEALEEFGTADPDELEKLIRRLEQEDEEKVFEYAMQVDALEDAVKKAEAVQQGA